jgi:hypothetical protein
MEEFLDSLNTDEPLPYPKHLLTEREFSHSVDSSDIELEHRQFGTRFEMARYLTTQLSSIEVTDPARERGIWSWIALFYFPLICPQKHGLRKPGERARWIPFSDDFRKYYRHLIAGPYRIFQMYRDDPPKAMVLLCSPPGEPGDLVEQLASRQEIVTNRSLIHAATTLYVDPTTSKPKRGAAGRGPGSVRRFTDIINQFDLTWDLYSMTADQILDMLPTEFRRFRK